MILPRPSVRPMAASTKLRNCAAMMMSMIIAVVRIVPSATARSIDSDTRRSQAARMRAATTPSEAASVGVAMPA